MTVSFKMRRRRACVRVHVCTCAYPERACLSADTRDRVVSFFWHGTLLGKVNRKQR